MTAVTTPQRDTFVRANASPEGLYWAGFPTLATGMQVNTNRYGPIAAYANTMLRSSWIPSPDVEVWCRVAVGDATLTDFIVLIARMTFQAGSGNYWEAIWTNAAASNLRLGCVVNGVETQSPLGTYLVGSSSVTRAVPAANDVLSMICIGNRYIVSVNGVTAIDFTAANTTTGAGIVQPGFLGFGAGSGGNAFRIDQFGGGAIGPTLPQRRRVRSIYGRN